MHQKFRLTDEVIVPTVDDEVVHLGARLFFNADNARRAVSRYKAIAGL